MATNLTTSFKTSLTLAFLGMFASQAFASGDYYSDQYHTLQTVELYEVGSDADGNEVEVLKQKSRLPNELQSMLQAYNKNAKSFQGLGEVLMATKQLIALGKEIYKIIEAGKPVVTIESTPVSVLPRDLKGEPIDPLRMSNWSAPKVRKYKVVAKNYLGMRPVSFVFMLIFSYGGKMDEKGFYLTGAQIKPTDVQVGWGYSLDASFKVQSIVNQGSAEDPVAGAVLMIDYTIKTVMKESRQNRSFFVNGLGHTQSY